MEPLATVFGRRLRLLRKANNLTQEQLGKKANIDYKHIGAIERGVKTPSFEAIERIAKAILYQMYRRSEEILVVLCRSGIIMQNMVFKNSRA